MREEIVLYRSTCEDCGEVEDLDTDELPTGWEELETGETYCPMHAQG